MNKITAILTTLLLLFTFNSFSQTLTKAWETDSLLDLSESAIYDAQNNLIYVSRIGEKLSQNDGNGFISKIGADGKIITLKWATGFKCPQGLGLFNNQLFVADVDRVVVVDIKTGKIAKEYRIEAAKFLNDVITDENGNVYVSDCDANKTYRISNDKIEQWTEDPLVKDYNSLLYHKGKLFALNMRNYQKVWMKVSNLDSHQKEEENNQIFVPE
jgi:outer membrane protein assembly factor BamB